MPSMLLPSMPSLNIIICTDLTVMLTPIGNRPCRWIQPCVCDASKPFFKSFRASRFTISRIVDERRSELGMILAFGRKCKLIICLQRRGTDLSVWKCDTSPIFFSIALSTKNLNTSAKKNSNALQNGLFEVTDKFYYTCLLLKNIFKKQLEDLFVFALS